MKKNRLAKPLAVAAVFMSLCAAPGLTRAETGRTGPAQTDKTASLGAKTRRGSLPADDFAGLSYTEEQKAEIDGIQRDIKLREDAVVKDAQLNADQRGAMLQGYTRLERTQIYKVLTPEQRRQVQQRIRARRVADQAAKQKQSQ